MVPKIGGEAPERKRNGKWKYADA
jgi:hypothetical protein